MPNLTKPDAPVQTVFDPSNFAGLRGEKDGVKGYVGTLNGKPRFFPDDPAASPAANMGAFEAAMINAGELTATTFDRISAMLGDPEALQRVLKTQAMMAPVQQERPVASAVGRSLPGFVLPGGYPAQIAGGAMLSAIESPENPGMAAGIGGLLGAAGKMGGDYLADLASARMALRSRSAARQAKGRAMQAAQEVGFPLTVADRTDSIVAQFFDRQASTVLGRAVRGPTKQRALNRAFAESIGVPNADALTDDVLGTAAQQYGEVFERAAATIDTPIPLTEATVDGIVRLREMAADVVPNARAMRQLDILENFTAGDLLTGEQYNRWRSQFAKISRAEWKSGGDQVSGEFVDEIIGVLDQTLTEAAPELSAELTAARSGWRQLLAIRRGAALDPRGNVNPVSMARNLESVYPGLDLGRYAPGAVGRAQRANLAANAFPEFKTSGTGERTILNNLGGLSGGLAELTLGGGAAGSLGGGAARSPAASIAATADGLIGFLREPQSE